MEKERAPWWLWPNLLSIDAPLVAIAWGWMFAKAWGVVSVPWQLWATLGLVVWMIYVLDRLVDVRLEGPDANLEKRHYFHFQNRKWLFPLMAAVTRWCLYVGLFVLSRTVVMYGLFVIGLAVAYFAMAMTQSREEHTGILKNSVAGLTFAYGTAAGIHAYSPVVSFGQMIFSWEVLLFAGLCAINMTAIDFWELEGEDKEDASALLGMGTLMVGGAAMFFSLWADDFNKPFFYAILVGAGGLHVLNRMHAKFDKDGRRLWVDLTIIAPVAVYWVWVRFDNSVLT